MTHNVVRAYRGNELIDALGDIRSQDDWLALLHKLPPVADEERTAPAHYRIHSVAELSRVYVARPAVIDLAMHVDLMIRQGYVGRHIVKQRAELLNRLPSNAEGMKRLIETEHSTQIISSTLLGFTGVGKTTSVEKILKTYRQLEPHEEHGVTQVIWLKIEMPTDGGIKQLALAFCYALENVLKKELPIRISDRTSTYTLLMHMARLCVIYQVGIIVVDEVQNLAVKKGMGRESMLNVLQTICNIVHVPLLLIGTMKAQTLFGAEARHARRAAAFGSFVWNRLPEDREWDLLLNILWRYQWTEKHSTLTDEIAAYLYQSTQGLLALLPVLLMLAQQRAILSGKEEVTLEIIQWVYRHRFQPVHAVVEALRSNDPLKLIHYEDLWLPDFLATVKREQAYSEAAALDRLPKPSNKLPPRRRAAIDLAHRGFDMRSIEDAIDVAVSQGKQTSAQIVAAARRLLENVEPETAPRPGDLRLQQGGTEDAA